MGNLMCKDTSVANSTAKDKEHGDIISAELRTQIDAAFRTLQNAEHCKSLLKKRLTKDVFEITKRRTTLQGATLLDVIRSGVKILDSDLGVYAPDAESYTVFSPLLDYIIQDFHGGFSPMDRHPPTNYGDPSSINSIPNLDPDGSFIISLRLRCARSVQGFPLNALMSRDQYSGIESRLFMVLSRLEGEMAGDYYPLTQMPGDLTQSLAKEDLLPAKGDRSLEAAGGYAEWPTGRGVFFNKSRSFVVWVNEADHVRVFSREQGGDLRRAYARLIDGLTQLEEKLSFSHSTRLGFLTFSPAELGTALRVSARARLPRLASTPTKLRETADRLGLRFRDVQGADCVVDVWNRRTLGLTEIEAVAETAAAVAELIATERAS